MCVQTDVLGVSKNVQKGPAAPKTDFAGNNKRGGGRADLKNGGVQKLSSFILTLVVKKKMEGKS